MREKRRSPRHRTDSDVTATVEGVRLELADVSQEGLGLRVYNPITLPRALSVDLDWPQRNLHLSRIPCRIRVDRPLLPHEEPGREGRHLGLEIVNPDGELLTHLEQFAGLPA